MNKIPSQQADDRHNKNNHLDLFHFARVFVTITLTLVIIFLYSYFLKYNIHEIFKVGILGYFVYFAISCLRGFTLIPATYITTLGVLFVPPLPLLFLTLLGIFISSLLIYNFSESFHFSRYFEHKHKEGIEKLKRVLKKEELPVVILWNLLPIVPGDLISYVCGMLKINKVKFLLGVLIGQGIHCTALIYLGNFIVGLS